MNYFEHSALAAFGALHRHAIRLAAAVLSAACAVIYLLIGAGVLIPVQPAAGDATGLLVFGLMAGSAFGLGAVLLLATDRRILWILGALFQVLAIVAYFQVAEKREPPFEFWGLLLKVLQAVILAALVVLIVSPEHHDVEQEA